MNPKTILATNPEIRKKVYERFPRNKAERTGCASEIAKREGIRYIYAKRLFDELPITKKEYE